MPTEILNYQIVRKIGEGGMGQVFLAKNKSIHQFVAIKMLHPRYSNSPALRDRFRQEAIMLSSLDHPNIVKFLNYVENDEGIFLIMEYVDGMTLEDYITKKTGLIVEERAFPMMDQILDAFNYAHGRGIVHRDIKPSNIFVGKDGHIKVLDFGIAQIMSETEDHEVRGGGSTEYMSPEQALDRQLDMRSDIYSLGVVFYQMLTGRSPYDTTSLSPLEIKKCIVESPLGRMKDVYPYISDEIQEFVDRATKKNPDSRFRNCREMRDNLTRIARTVNSRKGHGSGNDGGKGGNGGKSRKGGSGNYNSGKAGGKSSNMGVIIGVICGVVVLALAGIGYWLFTRNSEKVYADYGEAWAIPEGVGAQSSPSADALFYRIKYENGKLSRITLSDKSGSAVAEPDSLFALFRPVDVEFFYNSDGKLDYKNVYNVNGDLLYKFDYDDSMTKASVEISKGDTTAVRNYKLEFDDANGRLNKVYYTDESGEKIAHAGVYGEKYTYDKLGRLTRVTFINADDTPKADVTGVAIIDFDYSSGSHEVKSSVFDAAGKTVVPVQAPAPVSVSSSMKGMKKKKGNMNYGNPNNGNPNNGNPYDGNSGRKDKAPFGKDKKDNSAKAVKDMPNDKKGRFDSFDNIEKNKNGTSR